MTDFNRLLNPHSHSFNGMPVHVDRDAPPGRVYAINGQIYGREDEIHKLFLATQLDQPPTPPKAPMSTIDKIRAERKEKREREELEAKFEAWDAALGSATEGDIYGFAWTPGDKTYRYAAIYADKRWYLTGNEICGFATEDFIAWLISKDIDLQDLVFYEALT